VARVGDPLTYTLSITNKGGYKDELILVDDLPPQIAWGGYQYLTASPGITPGFDAHPDRRRVVWSGPVITGPTVITISWRGVISDLPLNGQIVNEMRIFDYDPQQIIRRTATTSVTLPLGLYFKQWVSHDDFAWVDEPITYTLLLGHSGPSLGPATISNQLPAGATWAGGLRASPGITPTYDPLGRRVEWTGEILTGSTTITTAWRVVAPQVPPGGALVNQAHFQTAAVEMTRTTTTTIRLPSQVDIAMTASPTSVVPGEPFTYTVIITNSGGFGYYMTMWDYMPDGLTWHDHFTASVQYGMFYDPGSCLLHWGGPVITGPSVITVSWQMSADEAQPGDVIVNRAEFHNYDPRQDFTRMAELLIVADPNQPNALYLPLIVKEFATAPDLIVTNVVASSSAVTVTIVNAGTATVVDAFWVDVYVNPSPAPPALNQLGDLWWGLDVANGGIPVRPGQVITLTLDSPLFAAGNPFPITPGSNIYAQVDSFGTYGYGEVDESNENNNVRGPVLSVAGLGSPPLGRSRGAAFNAEGLPPRR
jgi:hypothetical protein